MDLLDENKNPLCLAATARIMDDKGTHITKILIGLQQMTDETEFQASQAILMTNVPTWMFSLTACAYAWLRNSKIRHNYQLDLTLENHNARKQQLWGV